MHEDGQLRREAPTLFNLPKADPFLVEEGFFGQFPHAVQALVPTHARAPRTNWLKHTAIALPVLALLLFAVHRFRAPEASVADVPAMENLRPAAPEQPGTQAILAGAAPEEWPVFDSVTVQLTENEALAYIDQHNIDLAEYLY